MLNDLLMWNKIGRITGQLSKRLEITPLRALDVFYTSPVCDRLHDATTELYTFSDAYIADEVMLELGHTHC